MTARTEPLSLCTETRRLLLDSPVPLLRLGKQLNIPYQWMIKFRNGEIPDPSVNRIQLIYETLTGSELVV